MWPDVEKVAQSFQEITEKKPQQFKLKIDTFQNSPEIPKYLGYFGLLFDYFENYPIWSHWFTTALMYVPSKRESKETKVWCKTLRAMLRYNGHNDHQPAMHKKLKSMKAKLFIFKY